MWANFSEQNWRRPPPSLPPFLPLPPSLLSLLPPPPHPSPPPPSPPSPLSSPLPHSPPSPHNTPHPNPPHPHPSHHHPPSSVCLFTDSVACLDRPSVQRQPTRRCIGQKPPDCNDCRRTKAQKCGYDNRPVEHRNNRIRLKNIRFPFRATPIRSTIGGIAVEKVVQGSTSQTKMRKRYPTWTCLNVHRESQPFMSVYVDDIKILWNARNLGLVWKMLRRDIDPEDQTVLLNQVYLGLHPERRRS